MSGPAQDSGAAPDRNERPFIVGIGASAGGLNAIEVFFGTVPVDTDIAFVIVQHLSPDFKSLMDELLARRTQIPIHLAKDGTLVEGGNIYLLTPKSNITLEDGRLRLSSPQPSGLNLPIDIFFRSLANDCGQRCAAVVLSGTGSDGSRGIVDVHAAGGIVLVQNVESAAFDGMPRSAIRTNVANVVCAPDMMWSSIQEHAKNPGALIVATEAASLESITYDLPGLLRLFYLRSGIDFSYYKPGTIERRIARRMEMVRAADLSDYVKMLEGNPDEVDALYRDLLVEVTQFFRDPQAFEILKTQVLPGLIENKARRDELRIWVPGCATGEEAYSIAILVSEVAREMDRNVRLKLFASDVHRSSIERASHAVYSEEALESISEELRERYFTRLDHGYQVVAELRQRMVIATHDLTRDPPFTRMDLVSCRNLLIYFEPEIQQRVLRLLHFSLNKGGALFLGPSETLGTLSREFEIVDQHWRIFRKISDARLADSMSMSLTPSSLGPSSMNRHLESSSPSPAMTGGIDTTWVKPVLYEEVVMRYVPPCLVVNENHQLVHTFGDARRVLIQPEGAPTLLIGKLLEGQLAAAVTAALHHAARTGESIAYSDVRVSDGENARTMKVIVDPCAKAKHQLFLIFFEEEQTRDGTKVAELTFNQEGESTRRIEELRRELDHTRQSLQTTVEELESSNEELQSTNEELIAANEELQSTNEELHSVNEELHTVNAEHQKKIDDLVETTTDLDNFIANTSMGMVFLDSELRIRRFTPAITSVFRMLDRDIGRPLADISYVLDDPALMDDVAAALANHTGSETEISSPEGQLFLRRIEPYRGEDGVVRGVVVTFNNVTRVRDALFRLAKRTEELSMTQKELQQFAYAVSHDLGAPIRGLIGFTQKLLDRDDVAFDDEARSDITQVSEASVELQGMLDCLLKFSRIFTRGTEFAIASFDELFERAVSKVAPLIEETGAKVTCDELPRIQCDDQQMESVFFELLDNALKYRGDRRPVIHVSGKLDGNDYLISVHDNGPGIEKRHHDRIFQMFQRPVPVDVRGLGCGLAFCRRILDRHSGSIEVESTQGHGATFTFRIPADPVDRSRLEVGSSQ